MTIIMSIADVERDTGLSKDTLRVWERRYGFPQPGRDALGERNYAPGQVEKLRVIKRLMDAGHRPGRLVSRSLGELQALSDAVREAHDCGGRRDDEVDALLDALTRNDAPALRHGIAVAEARLGLYDFVLDIVAPLTRRVGEAWMGGKLRIFQEHLFTECVQNALRSAVSALPPAPGGPRVLLATVPGEPHGLGLLMVQTVLALEHCLCLSLGVQVPTSDIAAAAVAWRADIVALSFTTCMKRNRLLASLANLRAQVPPEVPFWVGGAAPALRLRQPTGVVGVLELASIPDALRAWRESAPYPDPLNVASGKQSIVAPDRR